MVMLQHSEEGSHQEPETQHTYLLKKRLVFPNISVSKTRFVIHPTHHWLGAIPEGLVNDPTSSDPDGIVEYKNPYSVRLLSLRNAATQRNDLCLAEKDGSLQLKCTHSYFYQVPVCTSHNVLREAEEV